MVKYLGRICHIILRWKKIYKNYWTLVIHIYVRCFFKKNRNYASGVGFSGEFHGWTFAVPQIVNMTALAKKKTKVSQNTIRHSDKYA